MTKFDFSAVKDARVGLAEIQKIYRGDNKVWHRYCWEKWSCDMISTKGVTQKSVDNTFDILATNSASGWYKKLTKNEMSYVLSQKAGSGYTAESAYEAGYKYMNATGTLTTLNVGDHFWKMTKVVTKDDGKKYVRVQEYEVVSTTIISGYEKGKTFYGVVEGSAGDYPDNGRHSDGYWYVRVAPQGVKEE